MERTSASCRRLSSRCPSSWSSLRLSRADRPILITALFILVILVVGTAYTFAQFGSAPLLSPTYLLQQLQIGAFLGIVSAGMMIVILIAQIDLSVPWTLAAAAMMATSIGGPLAIPVGLGVGLLVGLAVGLLFIKVLRERWANREDDHYEKTVEK